ncbi:transmembrane protein, putative [Medicago truncatula]|uniref:Transmembrane protein, putative n=1 Tax=Medicago truncatula TaxID=3880 RepID=A0A072TST7_MEDTR|nr:transmembrane protein, putative [Medicago truncatula]
MRKMKKKEDKEKAGIPLIIFFFGFGPLNLVTGHMDGHISQFHHVTDRHYEITLLRRAIGLKSACMAYGRNLVIEREKKKNGVVNDGSRSGNQKRKRGGRFGKK